MGVRYLWSQVPSWSLVPSRRVWYPGEGYPPPKDYFPRQWEGQRDTVGKRAVHIPLECFLVVTCNPPPSEKTDRHKRLKILPSATWLAGGNCNWGTGNRSTYSHISFQGNTNGFPSGIPDWREICGYIVTGCSLNWNTRAQDHISINSIDLSNWSIWYQSICRQ